MQAKYFPINVDSLRKQNDFLENFLRFFGNVKKYATFAIPKQSTPRWSRG